MNILPLSAIACLTTIACTTPQINFEKMSDVELAAYNEYKPINQMIVCTDGKPAFSRVRKRWCATVEQMYGSAEQAALLGVLNTAPGFR